MVPPAKWCMIAVTDLWCVESVAWSLLEGVTSIDPSVGGILLVYIDCLILGNGLAGKSLLGSFLQ